MPILDKSPEREKLDNRSKIFSILLEKSLTFTEILKESELARATVSKHLSELEEEGIIERALEERVRTPVYRLTLDKEKIESEFKKLSYDYLIKMLDKRLPGIKLFFQMLMSLIVQHQILEIKRRLEGKPPLNEKELRQKVALLIAEDIAQDEKIDPEHVKIVHGAMEILLRDGIKWNKEDLK